MTFPKHCFVFHSDLSLWDDSINKGKDGRVSAECFYFFALNIYTPTLFCNVSFDCLHYSAHPTLILTLPKPLRPHQTIVVDDMLSCLPTSMPLLLHYASYIQTQLRVFQGVKLLLGQGKRQ